MNNNKKHHTIMKIFTKHALCLMALCLSLFMASPCFAAYKPLWASNRAIEKLNAKRTNDTYRFVYTDPYFTDKGLLYENRMNTLVEQLAKTYDLPEDIAKVDTTAHIITFGAGTWFKYKLVDEQEVFSDDVTQNWDWTLYQLFAVSEKNTEPQYDEFTISEPHGAKSLAQSLIPGLGQWKKKQKDKAVVIWATEAVSISLAARFFDRNSYYKSQGWDSKAKSIKQMAWLSVGVAAGMYIYNLLDAYICKGGKTVTVKKHDTSTAIVPFATSDGAGMTFALSF